MCLLVLQYLGSWLVAYNWVSANPAVRTMPGFKNIVGENIGILLFNYPIVAGFAVVIKLMKRGWLKQQETLLVAREKAGAELQLLKSQIHPHFLFNTLNNVYFLTLTESQKAPEMLIKLSDMLRYILDECNNPQVLLEKEIKMVEDYMALEKIRYGDNLEMNLQVKGDHHRKMIVPLLLIPLVENSFKHGTSKMLKRPWVNLNISVEEQSLVFLLSNSKPDELSLPEHSGHIGLNNVKKRLHLLYPAAHELKIAETRNSFEIFMKIDLQERKVAQKEAITESMNYELA
jgi:LytS/YehU family sensor histidine kinase